MKKLLIITAVALCSLSANATTNMVDTLVVTPTPQMHCANCEKKITSNIRFVKGTKKIITSVPKQTVTIIYDEKKATYQDFAKAFKKIGYDIKKVGKK